MEKGARLQSLRKAPVDESCTKFSSGALTDSKVHTVNLPTHVLPDPQKGDPQTELLQREMLLFIIIFIPCKN